MANVNATLTLAMQVKETLTPTEAPAAGSPTITHAGFNKLISLTGTSTPPATAVAVFKPALTAGALTIDFTDLPKTGGGGAAFSASGLKLLAILFHNPGANAVVISDGASNGYSVNGGDDKTVHPGATWMEYFDDNLADIDGTHKTLDLAGTGTDEFECVLLFGD